MSLILTIDRHAAEEPWKPRGACAWAANQAGEFISMRNNKNWFPASNMFRPVCLWRWMLGAHSEWYSLFRNSWSLHTTRAILSPFFRCLTPLCSSRHLLSTLLSHVTQLITGHTGQSHKDRKLEDTRGKTHTNNRRTCTLHTENTRLVVARHLFDPGGQKPPLYIFHILWFFSPHMKISRFESHSCSFSQHNWMCFES